MKMMKKMTKKMVTVVLAMTMVLAMTACGSKATFEKGTVEGNVYTNTSVGVKATLPEGLTLADDATMQALEESAVASTQYTANVSEEEAKEAYKAITYELVANTAAGSNVQIVVEDMKQTIGKAADADLYLDNTCSQVETTYTQMGFTPSIEKLGTVQLGGVEFKAAKITLEGIEQGYYAYRIGDMMYSIITTAVGDDAEIMNQFIDSFEAAK